MSEPDWRQELPAWVREDRPLDEAGWLSEFHMFFVLDYLDDHAGSRKMRLFASACCRRAWDLLDVDSAKRIIELSESYADGIATQTELLAANNSPDLAGLETINEANWSVDTVQRSACTIRAINAVRYLASSTGTIDSDWLVQETSLNRANDFIPSPACIYPQLRIAFTGCSG